MTEIAVVILNWNGAEDTKDCIKSIKYQTVDNKIIVIDNGSDDNICEYLQKNEDNIKLIRNKKNLGFAKGVNQGISYAINKGYKYVALINNDAKPDADWLEKLSTAFDASIGIVTGKLVQPSGELDSTGDQYSIWGIPWPRGRGEADSNKYGGGEVFAASGGGSLYRTSIFKQIGLFDEDFFAYYEDVDLSFRAQLYGWKILYNPEARAVHKLSASSSKVPGLTAYMMLKNMVWVFWKNVPMGLMPKMLPRFIITYMVTFVSYLAKGHLLITIKALFVSAIFLPKKLLQRFKIQHNKVVDHKYINSMLMHDLPPNSKVLRKIRDKLGVKS